MADRATIHNRMRIWHRYLGFFLAGIMAVYSVSGLVMIFRDTNFLKRDQVMRKTVAPGLSPEDLAKAIRIREIKVQATEGDLLKFPEGTYNKATGVAVYTVKVWPSFINKLTNLHKANSSSPLFFLNVFFGISLFFFVLSSFWMFLPKTTIFKKGLIFTAAGLILALIMLFL
jgi:PepSY-associated TM region